MAMGPMCNPRPPSPSIIDTALPPAPGFELVFPFRMIFTYGRGFWVPDINHSAYCKSYVNEIILTRVKDTLNFGTKQEI